MGIDVIFFRFINAIMLLLWWVVPIVLFWWLLRTVREISRVQRDMVRALGRIERKLDTPPDDQPPS